MGLDFDMESMVPDSVKRLFDIHQNGTAVLLLFERLYNALNKPVALLSCSMVENKLMGRDQYGLVQYKHCSAAKSGGEWGYIFRADPSTRSGPGELLLWGIDLLWCERLYWRTRSTWTAYE